MRLYEILNEITLVEKMIDEAAEENYGLVPQQLAERLEASELKLDEKIDQMCNVLENKKAFSEAIRIQKRKLDEKLKINDRSIETIKNLIGYLIGVDNKRTIGHRKISWRKSESLEVSDIRYIPDTFLRLEPQVNKKDLKEYIKSGGEVHGVEIKQKKNLQIN